MFTQSSSPTSSGRRAVPLHRAARRFVLLGILVSAGAAMLGGCRTGAQNGALIGAGAGAIGGYVIGNEHDKD